MIAKQKQKLARQLQELEDPDALDKIEEQEKEKQKIKQENSFKRQEEKKFKDK